MFTDKKLVQLQETNQVSDQSKYLKMINKMKSNKDALLLFSKEISKVYLRNVALTQAKRTNSVLASSSLYLA